MREKGVELSPEALAKLDALPATFNAFRSALAYVGEPQGHGREARKPDLDTQTPEKSLPALYAAQAGQPAYARCAADRSMPG